MEACNFGQGIATMLHERHNINEGMVNESIVNENLSEAQSRKMSPGRDMDRTYYRLGLINLSLPLSTETGKQST